ncbi:DUF4304 domain-containing protein [Polaribacter sp. R77954]|uniref:DUF4304 domain-containing protein n=1 Tax=Polaribacter sp. R77954 TaxID=3093870 RepID=UPI0037CA083A
MNASEFKKLVAEHFSPKIRDLGWKGSGFHFRKMQENGIGNIFGIQGSWYGGEVCCETAINFEFMNKLYGIEFKKETYASSLIRKRLSPKGEGDHHWYFSNNIEKNIESVNSIWKAFEKHGLNFYNDFNNFPHPFDKIKPKDLKSGKSHKILGKYFVVNQIELTNILKELNLLLGNTRIAEEFSRVGLERINEHSKRILTGNKNNKYYKQSEKYIEKLIKNMKIK